MKKRGDRIRIIAAALMLLLLLCACGKASPGKENTAAPETSSAPAEQSTAAPTAETTRAAAESTPVPTETASGGGSSTEALTVSTEAEAATAEPPTEPEPTTEPGPVSLEIVLATYNIKHGAEGLEKVAAAIRKVSPDIIGLQEVDIFCERSGYVDEVTELAWMADYPYYAFSRAISLGSGEYGTALLSRYPIESFEVTPLASGNGEPRALGHAVVDVRGLKVDVFVTHLSYEDRSVRIEQMKTIAALLKQCDHYMILADLNSFVIEDISHLEAAYCVNRPERRYQTFHYRNSSPDNIVVSRGFTELSSGVSDADCSDHKLLYAVFLFSEE